MKNRNKSILFLCILVLSLLFIFSGCGNGGGEEAPEVKSVDITLSIDFPQKSKIIDIQNVPFKIEEETTVLQAIELYGNVNNISVLVDTTHGTLEGISSILNDVYQDDYTWKFKVNDQFASTAVSEQILENGDSIQFIYVKR